MLPELNRRIRSIVDNQFNGSVKKFSEAIGISQQKVNRIFNIDTRTEKYPTVPSDILTCVTELFVDLDARWLLTGTGEMLLKDQDKEIDTAAEPTIVYNVCPRCKEKERIITNQQERIEELKDTISILKSIDKSKRNSA